MKIKSWLPYIAIVVAMIIWSVAGIFTKLALRGFTPLTLVSLRFLMAVVLLGVIGLISHSLVPARKQDIPLFLIAGFMQPFAYFMLETYGMKLIASPTVAEVLLCTSPLFTPIFAFVMLREKITLNNIIGIIVSTIGVIMMIVVGNKNFAIGSPWAILLLMAAVFSAVLYCIFLRKVPERYNSLSTVFYIQLCSLLFFLPTWLCLDAKGLSQMTWNWGAFGAVVFLAVFSSVVAFVLFCYVVRQIGVTKANAFNNIRPVFTALFMLVLFGEHLPWHKWIAMAIVIVGLFICQYQRKATDRE